MQTPATDATIPTGIAAPMDPQIAEFMRRMAADAAQHPRRDTVGIAQGRQIAEKVRAPWAQGGPVMESTRERFVPTRHGDVRLRIHTPRQRELPGAFVYIHGGGFVVFSLDTHDRVMREYAERAGIVVIGIDYTRAPEGAFPRPLEECVDVVTWLADGGAAALGIDPGQIFIGGDSAGGNLSVGTCYSLKLAGRNGLVKGMVLNYGAYDTSPYSASVARYGAGEYGLSVHMMIWFYVLYLGEGGPNYTDPRMHLISADVSGLPPAYMVITECDPLYDTNVAMHKHLLAAGVDVEAVVYEGTIHSFLEAVSIADVAGRAFDDTVRWLQRQCTR
ncbi:alpha/beta hydrolase [Pseudorhodoferax sp.]|uniref:alpha/beta hydrolase n=1 Tax=Pseudorhodoferax sp. TaxID=1993553 RepID=UPI002DD68746|nr:alpha/beta hydrolase [Pseudorhodoferax sp.]